MVIFLKRFQWPYASSISDPASSRRFRSSNPKTNVRPFYRFSQRRATSSSSSCPLTPGNTGSKPSSVECKDRSSGLAGCSSSLDPLGSIPTNSRVTQEPAMVPTTRATPNTAYDPSAQPKRRAAMLTISTPTNPLYPRRTPWRTY